MHSNMMLAIERFFSAQLYGSFFFSQAHVGKKMPSLYLFGASSPEKKQATNFNDYSRKFVRFRSFMYLLL